MKRKKKTGIGNVHPDDWFAPYAGIAMTYDLPSFATHSWPEDGPWILRPERELTRGEVATAIFTILAPDDF